MCNVSVVDAVLGITSGIEINVFFQFEMPLCILICLILKGKHFSRSCVLSASFMYIHIHDIYMDIYRTAKVVIGKSIKH